LSDGARKIRRPRAARAAPGSRPPEGAAKSEGDLAQLEREAFDPRARRYLLRLYITGTTPASTRAIERVRGVCEEHLHGRYDLEVIDIYQMPALARDHQIVATPTLIKVLPSPLRRFIGDLSKIEKVLFGLDLREKT
jgi:circadian clock protein KaiB